VGEDLWGETPEVLLRASCPLGGGVAGTHDELCGVLSGAVLLAGARWGRTAPEEDDKPLYAALADLRERFRDLFGHTRCDDIRLSYPDVPKRCRPVVAAGARLVMEWFAEQERARSRA